VLPLAVVPICSKHLCAPSSPPSSYYMCQVLVMRAGTFYGRRAVVLDPAWKPGKATVSMEKCHLMMMGVECAIYCGSLITALLLCAP
jgi:hypothetical protein